MTDTSNRGFGAMDPEKQKDIAKKGGESVPAEERSFSKDPELAREAGQKGGSQSSGGTHEQHVEAGKQSHKKD